MEGYSAKISYASKELSAKEKIALKDTTACISLDEATAENEIVLDYAFHAIVDVHNERSDNKDYTKTIVVTKTGERYVTGSDSFTNSLNDIVSEMIEAGEGDNITIKVYRRESKNYRASRSLLVPSYNQ
mgnify:CR=1 FL=1